MSEIRVAIAFKDFAAWLNTSCVGLNVAGYATARVLNANGIRTSVFPVRHNVDLVDAIEKYNKDHKHPLTHVVISAPWLSVWDLEQILKGFPNIKFAILSHSNVGFLQADFNGVKLLREYQKLARKYHNLRVGGNSKKFVDWLIAAYGHRAILLPNLYPLPYRPVFKPWNGETLRIGAFGAVRPYKNFITAAAAAIALHRSLGVHVEFHMSTGGESGNTQAIEQLFEAVRGVSLIKHNWTLWPDFIKLVRRMDILMQPSFTESFNMITADGISVGVPSVVSSAITWAPESWQCDSDDAISVAQAAVRLLSFKTGRADGYEALRQHNSHSLKHWFEFLGIRPKLTLFEKIKNWFL